MEEYNGQRGCFMKPEEMEAAIIRNLLEKTGKSLEGWFVVLKESGLTEKRAMNEYLKNHHNVGHFQAKTVVKFYLIN